MKRNRLSLALGLGLLALVGCSSPQSNTSSNTNQASISSSKTGYEIHGKKLTLYNVTTIQGNNQDEITRFFVNTKNGNQMPGEDITINNLDYHNSSSGETPIELLKPREEDLQSGQEGVLILRQTNVAVPNSDGTNKTIREVYTLTFYDTDPNIRFGTFKKFAGIIQFSSTN